MGAIGPCPVRLEKHIFCSPSLPPSPAPLTGILAPSAHTQVALRLGRDPIPSMELQLNTEPTLPPPSGSPELLLLSALESGHSLCWSLTTGISHPVSCCPDTRKSAQKALPWSQGRWGYPAWRACALVLEENGS